MHQRLGANDIVAFLSFGGAPTEVDLQWGWGLHCASPSHGPASISEC